MAGFFGSRIPSFVVADHENELMQKLALIGEQLGQKVELITIYPKVNSGKVIAWYFHDLKIAPLPQKKKVTKKKVVKKKVK